VDHDPVVISHARALLKSSPEGKTDFLHADLRDTETIRAQAARTLDLRSPVAVLLIGVLHFIPDRDDPWAVVSRLMAAMPAGSYLVIVHAASDIADDAVAEAARRYNARSKIAIALRTQAEIARFFAGLSMLGPGLAPLSEWQPGTAGANGLTGHCGIGRKPSPS
jgi:O-methyltransferase involved in polyketide biosynthesis